MTNNDAINILRHLYLYKELEIPTEKLKQALAIAIKALEHEPKFFAKSDGTIEQIKDCDDCLFKKEWEKIGKLLLVVLEKQTEQEHCEDCISRADLEEIKEPMYDSAGNMIGYGVLMKWVRDLPSVQPIRSQEKMTNREKFKEVFGFYHSIMECPFPTSICEKSKFQCLECQFFGWWEKEYKPCFKLREDLQ